MGVGNNSDEITLSSPHQRHKGQHRSKIGTDADDKLLEERFGLPQQLDEPSLRKPNRQHTKEGR